jgi:glycerol uptake facilitator-like aquaporin
MYQRKLCVNEFVSSYFNPELTIILTWSTHLNVRNVLLFITYLT